MSGPIRKLIGPAKTRLLRYITEAETLLSSPIQAEALEEDEMNTEDLIERMSNNLSIFERCNRDWVSLLKDLKGEQKTAEEKEHSRVGEGTEGYIEVLLNAGELISSLKGRLKRIVRKLEQRQQPVLNPNATAFNPSLVELPVETHTQNLSSQNETFGSQGQVGHLKVNLPKLQLPVFDGDVQQWQEFWDIFDSSVHKQNLTKVSKFSYLKAVLNGTAASAVSGIPVNNDNYDTAITLLQEKFGRKEIIIQSLYSKLHNLPKCGNKFIDIQRLGASVEKILRQLEAQGEVINSQRMLIQLFLSKFPVEVIFQLEKSKEPTSPWTMENLRKAVSEYVVVQENVHRHITNVKGHPQQLANNQQEHVYHGSNVRGRQHQPVNYQQGVYRGGINLRGHSEEQQVSSNVFSNVSENRTTRALRPCIFCRGEHYNDECDRVTTASERKQRLSQQRRCFICLRPGHILKDCPSLQKQPCKYCGKRGQHNRCLCPEKFPNQRTNTFYTSGGSGAPNIFSKSPDSQGDILSVELPLETTSGSQEPPANVTQTLLASGERVLLQTAIVSIQNSEGNDEIKARVLLDSASQRTFMTNKLAQRLRLPSEHKEYLSVSTFGAVKSTNIETYVVNFKVKIKDGSYLLLSANVLKQITGGIQRSPLLQKDIEFLRFIPQNELADQIPNTTESLDVDILIGSDFFWDIVGGDKIVLPSGMFMLPSKFGYIVTGKCPDSQRLQSENAHTLFVTTGVNPIVSELSLQCCVSLPIVSLPIINKPHLENLWSLELIGIKDPLSTESDDEALEKFCENIKFLNGRYHITWPWKGDNVDLPDNFGLAFKRMKSLVHRLRSNKELLQNYDAIIKQQLDKGIIERVDTSIVSGTRKHYLPHHPVLTPSKVTTKVRIVYDASARIQANVNSLNECLHRGPVILPDLCGLLLRFRLYLIVILADIEKAFLQIGIQEFERDVTRFLWLRDLSNMEVSGNNLIVYRFCRVPFGLVCSPFLLGATLKFHLQQQGTPLSLNIMDNIYVDNVLVGADDVREACDIYYEAKEMFKGASMNLREWNSNSEQFLNSLPLKERSVENTCIVKMLGLLWNKVDDMVLISNIDERAINNVITKRDVLHCVAKIFDPLGLIIPVTFHAKIFLQRLWRLGQSWDNPLSSDLILEWKRVAQVLVQIPFLKLPRFVKNSKNGVNQLLVFCDASSVCYATTIYLRALDGPIAETNLVFSRMRLVPTGKGKSKLRKLTIPRLELLAVVIGIRAANFVVHELRLNISERIIWTDSQCVLYWLKTRKPLSVFVDNRIKEIKQQPDIKFRYIASSHNPADLATRGTTVSELSKSSLWWHGPSWLETNSLSWPVWNLSEITSDDFKHLESETKKSKFSGEVAHVVGTERMLLFGMERLPCSSLRGLLRISVHVLRFLKMKIWNKLDETKRNLFQHKLLKDVFESLSDSHITMQEIKLLAILWVYTIQHHYYKDIFLALKKNKRHCLQKQLGLQEDEYGILRCHGRYANADISEDMKCPKLLPRKDFFTELVILEIHGRLIHAGISHTLSQLRQEYWIPQGRAEVRRVIHQCVICKRHNGPSFCLPNMPPWPRERVSKARPFTYVGLDYLGPIQVKEGNSVVKMWVCLFTCLAVRAIHLELVKGLSAQLFLDCLRRFIARRGKPSLIISDNAPQFRLVKSVLDHQWMNVYRDETVLNFFSYERIQWQFTIALAPWQGGFYERLISMVKKGLRKGMGRKLLYWDKLTTLLAEVEAILNTRPLTYVCGEFGSGFVLTPANFLIGDCNNVIPFSTDDIEDEMEYLPKVDSSKELLLYWRKNQRQLQLFWKYWTQDYLLNLRETLPLAHKGPRSQVKRQPKIGEIVIIKDDNLPRRAWKLGRIKSYIFSKDNQIRAVKVQLANKNILDRAINHLYPLEIPSVADEFKVTNNELRPDDNVTNNELRPDDNVTNNELRPDDNVISNELRPDDNVISIEPRPNDSGLAEPKIVRKAAFEARRKLRDQLQLESINMIFSFPGGSVMEMEQI